MLPLLGKSAAELLVALLELLGSGSLLRESLQRV